MALPDRIFAPRCPLGKTGFVATRIGIGDLADRKIPLEHCVGTVQRALDAGLNLIDTAPCYEAGYSEQIVGTALKGRRDGVFVVDKIDHPAQSIAQQVEASLGRLNMDHADLFLFHGVSRIDVWESIVAQGGGMDQLEKCIAAGKSRFKGISSHNPEVLSAALSSGRCDVIMLPIGPYADPRYENEVMTLARTLGVGTISIKTFGAGKLLGDTSGYNQPLKDRPRGKVSSGGVPDERPQLPCLTVDDCLHYSFTIDPDVTLLGLSFPNEQDAAFAACQRFTRLSPAQMEEIRAAARVAIQGKGEVWWNPGGV